MENSQEVSVNQIRRESNSENIKHGINNWIFIFFIIFLINYVIENYLSYGILNDPFRITRSVITFIQENWWLYATLFLSSLFQIILCYINEKLLSVGFLPEKVGMALHVFNSLFLLNLSAVLFTIFEFNPFAGVAVSIFTFHMSVKFWGYAYANKVCRTKYRCNVLSKSDAHNGKPAKEDKEWIKYPESVTLKNTFTFMACTGAVLYKLNIRRKRVISVRKIFLEILKAIGINYICAFIIYQYIIPELRKTTLYIETEQYLQLAGSVLKLTFPVYAVWLLYFYIYTFRVYISAFNRMWGTDDFKIGDDWWNSENTTIFWSKWNYQVHMWFKECFFLPALRAGYSKQTAAFIVAFVSGVLHEYLICFPCRTAYGWAMFTMISQIPLAYLTTYISKKLGPKWGNFTVCLYLIVGQTIGGVFIYNKYVKM